MKWRKSLIEAGLGLEADRLAAFPGIYKRPTVQAAGSSFRHTQSSEGSEQKWTEATILVRPPNENNEG